MSKAFITEERQKLWVLDIDKVQQHPQNPNNGDTDAIGESLSEFGLYSPLTVQLSTHYILKGNHVWQSAKEKGETQILALFVDVDDDEAMRILVGDNETARRARPNFAELHAILEDLAQRRLLAGTGHTAETVAELADRVRKASHAAYDSEDDERCGECGQKIRKPRA